MKLNDHIVSVLKRNDRREMTLSIFEACENEEAAATIRDTSRITAALIDRLAVVRKGESTPEPKEAAEEPASVQENDSDRLNVAELKALVAKGKIKKAKKAFKKQFAKDYEGRAEIKEEIFGGKE